MGKKYNNSIASSCRSLLMTFLFHTKRELGAFLVGVFFSSLVAFVYLRFLFGENNGVNSVANTPTFEEKLTQENLRSIVIPMTQFPEQGTVKSLHQNNGILIKFSLHKLGEQLLL